MKRHSFRRRSDTQDRRAHCAFTLIELLIVVATIGLLVAILVPSPREGREQAKSTLCLVNLKGIAMMSLTYAGEDPYEHSIPVHPLLNEGGDPGAHDWGGKSGIGGSPTQDPNESPFGTPRGHGPATRPLNRLVYKIPFKDNRDTPGPNQSNWQQDAALDLPEYRCPSDRGYMGHYYKSWRDSKLSSYDHYGTSYCGNTLWFPSGPPNGASYSPYLRPLSSIPVPALTLYYLETAGRFAWHVNYHCGDASSPIGIWASVKKKGVVKGWHGRPFYFMAAYTDGHVSRTHIEGRLDPPPGFEFHGTTPDQCRKACHWIRGSGWRVDTHPAQRIYTNINRNLTPLAREIR